LANSEKLINRLKTWQRQKPGKNLRGTPKTGKISSFHGRMVTLPNLN
jgi:hypothetical protein